MTDKDRRVTWATVAPLLRRAVSYELGMWRSLYRWIFRRPVASGTGVEAFGYAGTVTPLLAVFIIVSAIEIPILHLVLPWPIAQVISAVIGAYGLLWMIGLLASLRVHPHVVSDSGLRLRSGISIDIGIGWDAVATIRSRHRGLAKRRSIQFDRTGSGVILQIVVLSQTNVEITLREPITIRMPNGDDETITQLHCYTDDPAAFVARAQKQLTAALSKTDN